MKWPEAGIDDLLLLHPFNHMQRLCLGLLLAFVMAVICSAQNDTSFSARGNLVRVPTLVRDGTGAAVLGLHANDFIIEDDGVAQPVHLDEDADNRPVSLMIAIQCGRRAKREYGRLEGLSAMLDPVLSAPENEAAVLFFDSKLNLTDDFTSNPDGVEGHLQKLPSGDGGAAILDAIAYSARLLGRRPAERQRVLLLISELRDHGSKFTRLDDALAAVDSNDVSVYALPFSPYVSQQLDDIRGVNSDEWTPVIDVLARLQEVRQAMRKNIPKTLATLTGGEYERFATRKTFENQLINFTNHLHNRYQLSFEPQSPHPGLHRIRVRLRTNQNGATLIYRTTYFVEASDKAHR